MNQPLDYQVRKADWLITGLRKAFIPAMITIFLWSLIHFAILTLEAM